MSGFSARLGGICAALFAILLVVGVFFIGDTPDSDAPDAEWVSYLNDSGNLTRNVVGAYIWFAAAVLFLVFVAALYRRLRAAEGGDGLGSLVVLVTGVVFAAMMIVGTAAVAAVPAGIKLGDTPVPTTDFARMLPQVGWGAFLVGGGLSAALMSATIGSLIVRTKTLPVWLGVCRLRRRSLHDRRRHLRPGDHLRRLDAGARSRPGDERRARRDPARCPTLRRSDKREAVAVLADELRGSWVWAC